MWNDTEFNSTFSSPGGAVKEVKKTLIKTIVPVTAHTINKCTQVEGENSVFEYGNMNFHQVTFIGIIRSVIKRANDITYMVDDMTSTEVNVKSQAEEQDDIESEEPKPEQIQFMENQYVKVFGIIKSLANEKIVQSFRIIPINELNQVTHHMLECMSASIHYAQGGESGDMNMDQQMGNENPLKKSGGTGGLNDCHTAISELVKQSTSESGIHLKDICNYLKSFPESKIKQALDFLSTEGHIYTTIDDEHYKSSDR
jgi:replication factor A2